MTMGKKRKLIESSASAEAPSKKKLRKSDTKFIMKQKRLAKKSLKTKNSSTTSSKTESPLSLPDKKGEDVKVTVQKKVISLPHQPSEYSSNWLKMMETLPCKKKSKKETNKKEEETEKKAEIWFDDVDEIFLSEGTSTKEVKTSTKDALVKENAYTGVTKVVAMDCEFVGVGEDGVDSILARASLVNSHGHCVYDKFVKATEPVVDYRTHVSGVREEDMLKGVEFSVVQKEVADLIKGKLLVGHAIMNDLKVLFLGHPKKMIRDTARFKLFKKACGSQRPSLKKLSEKVLKVKVQTGEHNSIEDAQAAMRLYTMYRQKWEKEIKMKGSGEKRVRKKGKEKSMQESKPSFMS